MRLKIRELGKMHGNDNIPESGCGIRHAKYGCGSPPVSLAYLRVSLAKCMAMILDRAIG